MHFKFITFTLALVALGRAASIPDAASKAATVEAVTVQDSSQLSDAIVTPVSNAAGGKVAIQGLSAATSPNSAFHALTGDMNNAIVVCTGQECTGSCYFRNLYSMNAYQCYPMPIHYLSAEVYSVSGAGYDFAVYGALDGCAYPAQFTSVNTCYDMYFNGQAARFSTVFIT
jgi:hypothetical protein